MCLHIPLNESLVSEAVIYTHLCWGGPNRAGTWKVCGELFPSSYLSVNWGRIFCHVGVSSVLFFSVFSTGSIETLQKTLVERVNKRAWFWGSESRSNRLSHKLTSDILAMIHHKVDISAFLLCLWFLNQLFRTLLRRKGASSWRVPKRIYQFLVSFCIMVHTEAPSYWCNFVQYDLF